MTTAPDPAPLTDEELAELHERYAGTDRVLYAEPHYGAMTTMADARCLLAEVDRLRAELAETRRVADHNNAAFVKALDESAAENTALAAKLDDVRELHTMERRFTDENFETSYDTPQEAAEALGISPGAAQYLDVCSHCGSIEMDAGAEDYKDSLWPCPPAAALGETGGTGA